MSLKEVSKNRIKLVAILILAIFCVLIVVPHVPAGTPGESFWNSKNFKLGLDLQGGTHLVYRADVSNIDANKRESALEGVRDVIERRVNAFGVSEPLVHTSEVGGEKRVTVELAGVKDVNQAIQMIGETPLLEFKTQAQVAEELTQEQKQQIEEHNLEAEKEAKEILNKVLQPGADFAQYAKEYSDDQPTAENGGDLGFVKRGMLVPEFEEVIFDKISEPGIYNQIVKTDFGYHIIKKIESRGEGENKEVRSAHILFATQSAQDILDQVEWENTGLSGKNLDGSTLQFDQQTGEPQVSLEFDDEGKELFAQITASNVGEPVAIFLDGEPISVPTVNEPIRDGKAVITGRFNIKEAKELVQRLNAGALPVPINLISQQTVGATLGHESVDKSLAAGLYGLIAVAIFMILFYRLPGIMSVIALSIYTAIVLTLFKLLGITLTLAGVAGFILSIGMAVDANVLIFERLKEEIRNGRQLTGSIEEGFRRAWTSIWDSNLSTLITCIILYFFGTSIIKGFALTLGVGVLISMFSAIVITRSLLRLFASHKLNNKKWLFGINKRK